MEGLPVVKPSYMAKARSMQSAPVQNSKTPSFTPASRNNEFRSQANAHLGYAGQNRAGSNQSTINSMRSS